jgi:hypothetical protein
LTQKHNKVLTVGVRLTPEVWAAAQKVAALTGRSASGLLGYAVELFIARNYPKAMNSKTKLVLALDEAPVVPRRSRRSGPGDSSPNSKDPPSPRR